MGLLAHVDAGKTTLSEALLYLSGKIRKLGRVDHKSRIFTMKVPSPKLTCPFRKNAAQ